MPIIDGEALAAYCASQISADAQFFAERAETACSSIGTVCGRSFDPPSGGATTRRYVPDGDDESVVLTHDIADATGVVVVEMGSVVSSSVLQWEPLDGLDVFTGEPSAVWQLRRIDRPWRTNGRQATVTVTTDQWGWPQVPPPVREAALIAGKDLAHVRDNRFGVAGWGEYGVVRIRQNPTVMQLLQRFIHPRLAETGSWTLT